MIKFCPGEGMEKEPSGACAGQATEEEQLLLARLIHAEAEGEPWLGMLAVGAVIVNRTRHHAFPDTITGVILQEGEFESVANGRLASITAPAEDCLLAARLALTGADPTDGALFFYNPQASRNPWIKERKVKLSLGNHLFLG